MTTTTKFAPTQHGWSAILWHRQCPCVAKSPKRSGRHGCRSGLRAIRGGETVSWTSCWMTRRSVSYASDVLHALYALIRDLALQMEALADNGKELFATESVNLYREAHGELLELEAILPSLGLEELDNDRRARILEQHKRIELALTSSTSDVSPIRRSREERLMLERRASLLRQLGASLEA